MKNKLARYTIVGVLGLFKAYDKKGNLLETIPISKVVLPNVPHILIIDCFFSKKEMNTYFRQVRKFIKIGVKGKLLN